MASSGNLTLIQMNDTHAYLDLHPELFWEKAGKVYRPAGGYARIATLVRQIRSENLTATLFFDNGDSFHGTYPAVQTRGQALVPVFNRLGLDAMTAHWEFAYGLQAVQQRQSELNYPLLALNIKRQDSGERIFPPYQVKEAGGLRVGVAGIASNISGRNFDPQANPGLVFDLGKADLPQVIDTLRREEKVDLVVVLSHLGFPQDMQLMVDVPGIDVLLSGHTHNRLAHPLRHEQTVLIQSGSHGAFLGCLDLTVEDGKISDVRHQLIEVAESIQPDPEIAEVIQAILQPFQEELSQVVGETATPLDRGQNQETTMDNLLLDAIASSTGTNLAFSNGWRYGAPIPPGSVTLNDLYNIIPVNPPVTTVELTGQEIWDMLEENIEHTYSRDPYNQMGGYLKRARGLMATFKVENPFPRRLQNLFVEEEEVHLDRRYTAAFVTRQGVPPKYGDNRQEHSLRAVDSLRAYLAVNRPLRIDLRNTFIQV